MPALHFEDDGEVTRARAELPTTDDPSLFALMHQALDCAARHRFGAAPEDDGETTFFRGAPIDPATVCLVEARPGRAAGGWWWFVARIVQGGEEKAHMERRMRVRPRS